MKMKAAVVEQAGRVSAKEVERPVAAPGEVLIRVEYAGICGSDLHIYHGRHALKPPPAMLGHESAGRITAVGKGVTGFSVGDRVVLMPQTGCGSCQACNAGEINLCTKRRVPGAFGWLGSMCEYINAPCESVFKIPDYVDMQTASMIEPLAVAVRVAKQLQEIQCKKLLILGSGTIGLMVLAVAQHYGVEKIICTDIQSYNLQAASEIGAARIVNVLEESLEPAVGETFNGQKADGVVIAALGPGIIDQALACVKAKGLVMLLPTGSKPLEFSAFPLVNNEIILKGNNAFSVQDFADTIELVSGGKVDTGKFLTHVFPIDEIEKAMELMDKRTEDFIKIIIQL